MYQAQMHNGFKTSTNEWIGKMRRAYTTQYLLFTRNKTVSFSGKQMEMNSIVTSEISQTQTCFLAYAKLVFKKVIIWEEGILGEGKETREGKRGVKVIKVHCI